jgi:lipid A 4'-phosphatase
MSGDKTSFDQFRSVARVRGGAIVLGLLALGIGSTAILDRYGWDLAWCAAFSPGAGSDGLWIGAYEQPWRFLYDYGEIPGIMFALTAAVGYAAAKVRRIRQAYATPCLLVILTLVMGPGIVVNGMLKNYWGRPRPADIAVFGGTWEYRKVSEPGIAGRGKSFPCGHCSMAFALASGAAFFPLHPTLATCSLVGGIAYGLAMGTARVAQGGHFPSDVIWSGVLVLAIVTALYYLIFRIPENTAEGSPRSLSRSRGLWFTAFLVLPCLLFLFQWPFYEEKRTPVTVPAGIHRVVLDVAPPSAAGETLSVSSETPVEIRTVKRGLGAPWARITDRWSTRLDSSTLRISYEVRPTGYFWEWSALATLARPTESCQ